MLLRGQFRPAFKEIDGLRNIRIPDRLGCVPIMLDITFPQSGDRRPLRAIYLEGKQVIPPYPYRPG